MKQIRNNELVQSIVDRGDGYFHWLQKKSGLSGPLSSMLADTEFISIDGLDDVLMNKAKEEVRKKYAEEVCENDEDIDTVYKSIRGNCCLFEVILCLAFSINEMFEDSSENDGPEHFFEILMKNCGLDKYDEEYYDLYPDKVKEYWQKCIDKIINRGYSETGDGGLFPIIWPELYYDNRETYSDRRAISLWQQMNDWIDEHTNEDGEWID